MRKVFRRKAFRAVGPQGDGSDERRVHRSVDTPPAAGIVDTGPVHVLVVDDDPQIARALRINLAAHGHQVTLAADGATALRAAADRAPDVVVLDLGLPDLDGTDVIAGIRGWSAVPIVVLSARADPAEKVAVLDAGADDYVTKPFGMAELLARLRAAARRAATVPGPGEPVVEIGELTVDLAAKRVRRGDDEVHLTPTEWGIVEMLVAHRGKLVGQRELLRHVWGPQYEDRANYLRVYLAQLRRKLERDPAHPRHLITEPGMGYRLDG
ncbi:response regulator [Pseudonocardia ailaonensis]|uniref:Response regulator n=1 Tax=Pseudonocardia ailaonensis TaxID=367279 RepID=A0ABN2N3B4_9PSEU